MDIDLINISPYQMFLLHIRSLKTKSQYIQNMNISLNFLLNNLKKRNLKQDIEKKIGNEQKIKELLDKIKHIKENDK
jgi:hypothetical protein